MDDNSPAKPIWLFQPLEADVNMRSIWIWWEKRRIVYNAVVIVSSVISFAVYVFMLLKSGHLGPGEEIIEPIAWMAYVLFGPIIWNIAYCLGPILDAVASSADRSAGPPLLKAGLIFSILVVSFPAVYWTYMCLFKAPT